VKLLTVDWAMQTVTDILVGGALAAIAATYYMHTISERTGQYQNSNINIYAAIMQIKFSSDRFGSQ